MPRFAWIAWVAWVCVAAACGRPSSAPRPSPGAEPASSAAPRVEPDPAPAPPCERSECGPEIKMPNRRCPDGSIAGPTGRCLRLPDGRCGWEVRHCP